MVAFILNLPYTIVGLLLALVSVPKKIYFQKNPYTFIVTVKNFWWVFGYMKNARAMASGHTILIGPNVKKKDLEHELIHVEQHQRMPLIQPILYYIELMRKGYKENKYEKEAYGRAGNFYREN
jgi:hypothetical protein